MNRHTWAERLRVSTLLAICLAAAAFRAAAVEPARRFVDALRRGGYYDEAVAYLEQQRSVGRVSEAFRETIDYELGLTLLESSRTLPAPQRRERLRLAEGRLAAFLEEHPQHASAAAADSALAEVLVACGRLEVEEAGRWASGSAQRLEHLRTARLNLSRAEKTLAESEQQGEAAFKKLGFVNPQDLKRCQVRDQLRRQILQAKLARTWAHEEIAQTYEPGSAEFRATLADAARQFAELAEQQRDQLAGLYARLGEGSCYRRLGEAGKAFAIFEGLLVWPDEPEALRTLKTRAAVAALETALLPGVNKYKEALDISRKWQQAAEYPLAGGGESAGEEGLAIRFLGGEAALAYARSLAGGGPEQARLRQECLAAAKENFAAVAAAAGRYQQKAKLRLLEPALVSTPEHPPATFAEARDRLQAAIERVSAAEAEVRLTAAREVEVRRACERRLDAARTEATCYARLALQLAAGIASGEELPPAAPPAGTQQLLKPDAPARDTAGVPSLALRASTERVRRLAARDELDGVRYYLAYLCFSSGDMEEAAVLGESLAKRAENSPRAREGARIALAAYDALLQQAPAGADRRQARQRLVRLAESIVKRWPTHREADDARMVLLEAALDEGRLEQAQHDLDAIATDSPRRGEAELALGQALWTAYRQAARGDCPSFRSNQGLGFAGGHIRREKGTVPLKAGLRDNDSGDMLARAWSLLHQGMQRMREPLEAGGAISGTLAAASLAMAEMSLEGGRSDEAIQRLEDPKQGAKTLVDIRDRAAQWGDFPAETYRVALRAYVAAGQEEAAEQALVELENIAAQQSGAAAAKRLSQMAVRLGRDVEQQLVAFRRQRQEELAARWVGAMDAFLTHVAAARDQASFFRLNAVAEGFYGLGAGLQTPLPAAPLTVPTGAKPVSQPEAKPPAALDAQKYYRRAAAAFQGLLRRCDREPHFAPQPEAVTAVRVRLAGCLRRLGQFADGLDMLRSVLKEHRTMVDAQVEAAYTYQGWGETWPDGYRLAILGDPRSPEIWGWAELARQVEPAESYRDVLFTARYNLALCRFRQAQSEPRAEDRAALLAAAREDIRSLQRAHPGLGGQPPAEGQSGPDCCGELLRQIEEALSKSTR
jgi:hypothetical protein